MVSWLKRSKSASPTQTMPRSGSREETQSIAIASPPDLALEPDYSNLERLQWSEAPSSARRASILIVGAGPVGEAVLESLTRWLPQEQEGNRNGVQLLAVRCRNAPAVAEVPSPSDGRSALTSRERLFLDAFPEGANFPWYPVPKPRVWTRADSRLGVFQDLANHPSALWEALVACVVRGGQPGIWIVGSAFEAEGSGLIFDLAHVALLVGRAQLYEPSISWMLALPGARWKAEQRALAGATLKELARQRGRFLNRVHEYNPGSDNNRLWRHEALGIDAARSVLLCEPAEESRSVDGARAMINKMALALAALTQPTVWASYRTALDKPPNLDQPWVSAFGVCAHYVQVELLQEYTRTRLARDVLTGNAWGALRNFRTTHVDSNREAAQDVLLKTDDRALQAVAQGARGNASPPGPSAEQALRLALRDRLERALDQDVDGNELLACEGVLTGLEDVLEEANASPATRTLVEDVLAEARREINNWRQWLRQVSDRLEEAASTAERGWQSAAQSDPSDGVFGVLKHDTADKVYSRLVVETPRLRRRMRQYVRLAWAASGETLKLYVDTLYPGYERQDAIWRHSADIRQFASLWQGVNLVVEALTQEAAYWPQRLFAPDATLPAFEETAEAAAVMLRYQEGVVRNGFLVSGDQAWRSVERFRTGVAVSSLSADTATLGVLLQIHHGIPVHALTCQADLQREYDRASRSIGGELHIFEAEQLARRIELAAGGQAARYVYSGLRQQPAQQGLSPATVAALQWPDALLAFVVAQAAKGQRHAVAGDLHPLNALHSLVVSNELPKLASARSPARVQDHTSPVLIDGAYLDAIEAWQDSPDARNVEWHTLVFGLIHLSALASDTP